MDFFIKFANILQSIMRVISLILITAFIACGCTGHTEYSPAPMTDSLSHHELASKMLYHQPLLECIAEQQKAVDDAREHRSKEPAYEVLSQMGYMQCRAGNYLKGLEYLLEANDSLKKITNPDSTRTEGAVMLLGNLSNLYTRLALYDEAKEKNTEAINLCKTINRSRIADLLRMRAIIYEHENMLDSANFYYDEALAECANIENENHRRNHTIVNENSRAYFYIEHPDYAPDSIRNAVDALERNLDKYPHSYSTNLLLSGRGHVLLGNTDKGLQQMEKAVELYRNERGDEDLEFGLRMLAISYATAGSHKLNKLYPEVTALHDSIMNRQKANALLGKDFQYRTIELNNEIELMHSKLQTTRQHIIYIITICVLLISSTIIFLFFRRKQQKQLLQQKEQSINMLIADRISLNAQIDKLNSELNQRSTDDTPQTLVNPLLLEKDNEIRFRKIFYELHPGFVEKLRDDFPNLTAGNELLCMLIKLRKSNDDIALALGISRESVATARYRLRTRFKLPKDVDLNEFIQNR